MKRTLEIDAPAKEVWRVLTTPELVEEWAGAYHEGLHIRTSFREGASIAWEAADGATRSCGKVSACQPDRLLKFDYDVDGQTAFSDTFEIRTFDDKTRLEITTGPLAEPEFEALQGPSERAIEEIKSLAEESAQIHGVR